MYLLVCIIGYLLSGYNAGVAPFITPCKITDEPCLISSAQAALPHISAGVPELGLAPVVPLLLDDVSSSESGLDLKFRQLKLEKLDRCQFLSVHFDSDTTLTFEMACPFLATGKYTVGGKILFIPIEGEGDFKIETEKIKISITAKLKTVDGANGKKHMSIESVDYTYDPVEKIYIQLDNLFNGDQERAKPILEILNNSWKELVLEIGKPIIHKLVFKAKDIIGFFFDIVPKDELVLY